MIPLLIGIAVYIICRPGTIVAGICRKMIPMPDHILHISGMHWTVILLKNYICDMLWAYALTIFIIGYEGLFCQPIWRGCVVCLGFTAVLELLQLLPFVAGTFDVFDILSEWLMVGLAAWNYIVFYNRKTRREAYEEKRS